MTDKAIKASLSDLRHWANAVKSRDNFTCQSCGLTRHLHAHHIKTKAERPDLALTLSNGLTLCVLCHADQHQKDATRGRPPVPAHLKKRAISVKLPPAIIDWLREQDESQAVLIEQALRRTYKIDAP